ncbi:transposase [Paraburkholderia sp. BR14320]|uniref:transposase n=1 Tax=unclassified Paraburkholderia TaxID=2615204 RepID=UPI0034CF76CB
MPYKARLKTGEPRKRAKPGYAVTNAHEYNESLKRRGQLSLYCPDGDLKALFINDTPYQKGVSGQSQTYSDAYLELIFIFYRLLGWGMRQITGHMHEFWALRGLDIGVPSFGLLSERFRTLEVQVKQRCARVAERLRNGEAISLIVDSSGMKFGRASEWHRQKYGRDASQTPWRKMHLSIDPEMNVHQIAITGDNVSDEAGLNAMLAVDANVDCVIADGATTVLRRPRRGQPAACCR